MKQQPRESKTPGDPHVPAMPVGPGSNAADEIPGTAAGIEQASASETVLSSRDEEAGTATDIPFWRVVFSVLQASFGVQSPANRERDFGHGKALPFIVAALMFTGLFVLTLMLVVNLVLD